MNTKQRDAILFWALAKNFQIVEMSQQFNEKEAYAVLPDGIRAYIGSNREEMFQNLFFCNQWFDKNESLKRAYTEEHDENMHFSPELQERIAAKIFHLMKNEIKSVYMVKNFGSTLDEIYHQALVDTMNVLNNK